MSETSSNKSTSNISHSNKKKPTFSTDYLPNLFHDSQKLVTAPNRTIFQKSAISETSAKESDKHESDDIASFVNNANGSGGGSGGGGSGGDGSRGGSGVGGSGVGGSGVGGSGVGGSGGRDGGSGGSGRDGDVGGGGSGLGGADYDNYNELAPEAQMLKKLDMLRKLGELAQYGVKLSQNYNMSSDYFTMKYEYELHKNIRAKQNSVNWMSSLMLNCIYGVEILNDKYNPFDLKLKNWSEQINADINNYYDIFGEIADGVAEGILYTYKYFLKSSKPEILQLTTQLIGFEDELSPKWASQYRIYTKQEDSDLLGTVLYAIYNFKQYKITEHIKSLRVQMASETLSEQEQLELLAEQMAYEKIKQTFSEKLGRIIIK